MEYENTNEIKRIEFLGRIKLEKDEELEKLLKIQEIIEETDINEKDVYEITKNLSDSQKLKLQQLYEKQINSLKENLNYYKNKIIKIRNNI